MTIKNIFIPQSIGSYFLMSTRHVGLEIKDHQLYATIIRAQGKKRIIEQTLTEPISHEGTIDEGIIQALTALSTRLGKIDGLCCVLPSSLVIFKELSVPFIGLKKAKLIVPFEIEAQLPFPLDAAVIDCVVTKEDKDTTTTNLLVAAAQKETINRYIHYFEAAGLMLTSISVDMIELFKLYELSSPAPEKAVVALIDMGPDTTRVAISVDKRLAYIRTLAQGYGHQADMQAKSEKAIREQNENQAQQEIIAHELTEAQTLPETHDEEASESMQLDAHTKALLDKLLLEIQFTIDAYKPHGAPEQFSQIVLSGAAGDNPQIAAYLCDIAKNGCSIFQPQEVLSQPLLTATAEQFSQRFMVSAAAALKPSGDFNLNQEYEQKTEDRLLTYQLIALAALAGLILVSFSLYSFLRVRTLRQAHQAAQTEAIQELQKSFKLKGSETVNLTAANKAATKELKRQESAWNNLSQEHRYAFLTYLTELSTCLNAKDLQLEITSLVMKDDTIKLYGSVPGYPQLTKLQKQLECPLFKKLPKLQDWNFKTEPITLVVQK